MPIIRKTCTKCGGRSERLITLHNSEHNADYEIYRCVDCKSIEWLPRTEQSEAVRD
jgi:ssDNA-binding Zn-finger/Zn-ribbon topoisomerase 1